MKTKLKALVINFGLAITLVNANTVVEKLNTNSIFAKPAETYESQAITAAKWADGEYKWFTKRSGVHFFDLETEKKALVFTKNDKGEVTELKMNGKLYVGDEHGKAGFIRYFRGEGSWNLFFTKKCVYIFRGSGETNDLMGCLNAKCKYEDVTEMNEFVKATRSLQEEDLKKYEALAAEKAKADALEKEKQFSIKDKTVAKIEVVNIKLPEKFGHYTSFTFDIKATLKDGTILSTESGGFWSDYTVTYEGGSYKDGKIQGVIIKDDKIKINVVSKFDANVKTSSDVVPLYNQDISFNYNGITSSRSAGASASNFKLEVKQMKHKSKGNDVLAIRITNLSTGTVESEFKMSADKTLHFWCKGGSGGTDNGRGNDGANGGNLTIIKDPSVKDFNLDYSNIGGKGGKGANANYDGRAGKDGAFKEEVKPVNL